MNTHRPNKALQPTGLSLRSCPAAELWRYTAREVMDTRSQFAFLLLILAQAAHSVEEYAFRLYDVFAPARLITSLVSDDLATGFVIANAALVLFGLWCYIARVRVGHRSAGGWVWLWLLIEFVNGIGHPAIVLMRSSYFPGVVMALVLLALSVYLAVRMSRNGSHQRAGYSDELQHGSCLSKPDADRLAETAYRS